MDPCIEARNLSFAYPDGRPALRDVSLTVAPGERVALVGPNGAGKSTLLLLLAGLLRGQGTIALFGEPLDERNLRRARARVGLVLQDPDDQLFSPTVYEDVAFGPLYAGLPEAEVRRRTSWALEQVGLEEFGGRSPHHLSLGEKKRAAIATILSMQPEVLALDEPTAGLDPRARRRLVGLLESMPQTMLAATHDLHLAAALFPRVVVLDHGAVVADGPTAELLAKQSFLEHHGLA
jgi:cobalt/nickel transport system ATP-binding protein